MSTPAPHSNLVRSKAFWLALVFNWACLGAGLWMYLTFDQELPFVLIVVAGGLPMAFVILRYTTRLKAATLAKSNPKIVE